jgi:hypothetical protein
MQNFLKLEHLVHDSKLVFKWLTKVITLLSLQNEVPRSRSGTSHEICDVQLELFQSNMLMMMMAIYVYMQQLLI